MTYSYVLSRDLILIFLTMASHNYLEMLTCEIHNSYLTEERIERVYILASPDFGSEAGHCMLSKKAL